MTTANFEQIKGLIEELKVNDREEIFENRNEPKEPKEAIDAIIKIGKPAIEPLLELLKNPTRKTFTIGYAIRILGEIMDSHDIIPLCFEVFDSDLYDEDGYTEAQKVLQKIGLPALEPILNYIKEDRPGVICAPNLLRGIRDERSFNALIELLSHPDEMMIEFVVSALVEYGDSRAVEHLIRLLNDKERSVRSQALESINHLVDLKRYRSVLKAHKELSLKRLESHKNQINSYLRDLERVYEGYDEFKGDNTLEINEAVSEYTARKVVWDLLLEAIWLGATEGIITKDMYEKAWSMKFGAVTNEDVNEKLGNLIRSLHSENNKIREKYDEEISYIIDKRYPSPLKTVKRSYRGLARNIELAKNEIHTWLKEQGLDVLISLGNFWARKSRDKSCFIDARILNPWEMERKRIYGEVTITFCGSLWNNEEINSFEAMFWGQVENTLKKMLRKGEKVEYC